MLTLIALLALAGTPCPCGPKAACADARCESHGGSGACMCRFPAPKFATAVYASIPAPKFKGESKPVAKETHADCECDSCQCAVCDGSCSPVAASVDGKWVVTLNGRRYTVDGSETKDDAVRLAKKVAGEPSKAVAAPSQTTRMVKGHRHTCPKCGRSWEHADNDPSASHVCPNPKCRTVVTKQSGSVLIPVTPPTKPKRVNIGGKWYDQYADGRLVECSA